MALLELLRFRLRLMRAALTIRPAAGGAPEGDEAEADNDSEAETDKDDEKDGEAAKVEPADDWKAKSRKNETRAKKAERARDEMAQKLKEREEVDQSEQEKAITAAREEARTQALSEAEKDRRGDRLEVAVTRQATRGIKIGEGDDAKTVKFADPEDALLRIERQLSRGDMDADDLYDDQGRPKVDALTEALMEIAAENPHLVGDGAERRSPGDPDVRKGDPAKNDLESMTPAQHAARKYPAAK